MKASCKTAEYKKIRPELGQLCFKRLFGRLCAHSAFDQDDLFSGKFGAKLLKRFPSNETPGREQLFKRQVFLRQGSKYQDFHIYVRPGCSLKDFASHLLKISAENR